MEKDKLLTRVRGAAAKVISGLSFWIFLAFLVKAYFI